MNGGANKNTVKNDKQNKIKYIIINSHPKIYAQKKIITFSFLI
jgi:hypothetical protein